MKIGVVGTGQFAGSFVSLWQLHPWVDEVYVTDLIPDRAEQHRRRYGLAGTFPTFEDLLDSDCDAVAVTTQRWHHGRHVLAALNAGKHVFSAVPMGMNRAEIEAIVAKVERTGLIYMMGETSYYNPAVVWARKRIAAGDFGRVFYAEGDYVHDMDNGFYAAYQYSGGQDWKRTASFPPMLYPTHAVGGVLGALGRHAVSVSCLGVVDDRGDGVFDQTVSDFDNDFSNMSALFELDDTTMVRTNEFRRVGHPAMVHESRFRFYGTDAVMEQTSTGAAYSTRSEITDISELFDTGPKRRQDASPETSAAGSRADELTDVDPNLVHSFSSGTAKVHDRTRLPAEFAGAFNGHEGSHHFLADDFVRAVTTRTAPPVDAWTAARYTLPGIVALESARQGGARLSVPDLGPGPA